MNVSKRKFIFLFFFAIVLLSCSSPELKPTPKKEIVATNYPVLLRDLASQRAKQVTRVSYILWFGLDNEHDDYQARTVINFELKEKAKDYSPELLIDFHNGQLASLSINGKTLELEETKKRYNGNQIRLNVDELKVGANRIEVAFSRNFSKTRNGFIRFIDPIDQQRYLYSIIRPYTAHWIFPCFDQPDLKAPYEVTVEAPEDWEVITNTKERDVIRVDGRSSWNFPPSAALSTHRFALHAGPFVAWSSEAEGIPIRLLARDSIRKSTDSRDWLLVTKKGLEYFNGWFGHPYPFSKYDQVLIPGSTEGTFEGASISLFSESLLSPDTISKKSQRARHILVAEVHNWLGALVTMRWWNGIWLTEGFGHFLGTTALAELKDLSTSNWAWQSYYYSNKVPGYRIDASSITRPIDSPVTDTTAALANLDAITYGKGAGVFKQLAHFVGTDDFKEGLLRFLNKFSYRTATITDFTNKLSEAGGKSFFDWQKLWLSTTGINTISTTWTCEHDAKARKKKISSFFLKQNEKPVLRPHRTKIGLFYFHKNKERVLQAKTIIDVSYKNSETVVTDAIGQDCPDLVFPNYDDLDVVAIELDPTSLENAKNHLSKVFHPLTRQLLFSLLLNEENLLLLLNQLKMEKDPLVLDASLDAIMAAENMRNKFSKELEHFLYDRLLSRTNGIEMQKVVFNRFLDLASSSKSIELINAIFEGKRKIPSLSADNTENRWQMVKTLARNNAVDLNKLFSNQLVPDESFSDLVHRTEAEVLLPDLTNKRKWLERIYSLDSSLSREQLLAAVQSFYDSKAEDPANFITGFFDKAEEVATISDPEIAMHFLRNMFPPVCNELVKTLSRRVYEQKSLPVYARRALKFRTELECGAER